MVYILCGGTLFHPVTSIEVVGFGEGVGKFASIILLNLLLTTFLSIKSLQVLNLSSSKEQMQEI